MDRTAENIWQSVKPSLELENHQWLQTVLGKGCEEWTGGVQAVLTYLADRPAMAVMDRIKGPGKMIGWMFDEMIEAWTAENNNDRKMEYADVMVFGILTGALHWQEMSLGQKMLVMAGIKLAAWRLQSLAGSAVEGNKVLTYVASEKDTNNYPVSYFQIEAGESEEELVDRVQHQIVELHSSRNRSSLVHVVVGDE